MCRVRPSPVVKALILRETSWASMGPATMSMGFFSAADLSSPTPFPAAPAARCMASINQESVNFLFKHGTYSPMSIPNAPSAVIYGINPAGTALVGYYQPVGGSVGFLYQNKTTQTLQFPGAIITLATGINAAGEIV